MTLDTINEILTHLGEVEKRLPSDALAVRLQLSLFIRALATEPMEVPAPMKAARIGVLLRLVKADHG